MGIEWGDLLTLILQIFITTILPFLLKKLVDWMNAHISTAKASAEYKQYETALFLVRQLVLAAEQNGLTEKLQNIGIAKKQYVLDLAQAELARHGIKMDLDMLDALIEAQVRDALKQVESPLPDLGSGAG
jgi:hypothetical protein